MARFRQDACIKAEFLDESTGESKRMWAKAEADDEAGIQFGRLDSAPLLGTDLYLWDQLSVSYYKATEGEEVGELLSPGL